MMFRLRLKQRIYLIFSARKTPVQLSNLSANLRTSLCNRTNLLPQIRSQPAQKSPAQSSTLSRSSPSTQCSWRIKAMNAITIWSEMKRWSSRFSAKSQECTWSISLIIMRLRKRSEATPRTPSEISVASSSRNSRELRTAPLTARCPTTNHTLKFLVKSKNRLSHNTAASLSQLSYCKEPIWSKTLTTSRMATAIPSSSSLAS